MIITLSHQKGGVGKSTIAWNLAVHFSKVLPTTIIDLDIQQSLTQTNKIRESTGLEPLHIKEVKNSEELISHIQDDNDQILTIIDSGGFDSTYNRIAISGSDILITPVSDKPFDLMGLQKYEETLKTLSDIQGEIIKTNIVFNNLNPAMKNFGELIEFVCTSEHFDLMVSVLRQRVDIAHSIGVGKSIKEYRIFGKADKEFDEFFKEIQEKINI
jgi:chromosome partitioning protein